MVARLACAVAALTILAPVVYAQRPPHGPLFPPEQLGILESPDRDAWQQPDRIMDALAIGDASRVADLGAGGGWFTIRLAHRVGPNGRVYAQDIQPQMIESIRRRVETQGLRNVETILGTPENPGLPANLDAVLVVDAYPQFAAPLAVLRAVERSLAPNGHLGIVDFRKDGAGGPGPPISERLDAQSVIADATQAGLRLTSQETFLRYQYLLVFGK
jgi:ubiquinone/menaquinone biosynthesis C-methylase UbiE